MRRRKNAALEPMPKSGRIVIGIFALVVLLLVLGTGKFYLFPWRGDVMFLSFGLLVGVLLVAALAARAFRRN
jgi:TM2 domain-containing membrane protein YozV